jgi:hypothetical protein
MIREEEGDLGRRLFMRKKIIHEEEDDLGRSISDLINRLYGLSID